jgi:Protein of unknown function (DUF3015)
MVKQTLSPIRFKGAISGIIIVTALLATSACTIVDFTSSTSSTLDTVTPDVTLNRFVDVRIASIKKEAAAGEGENLDALAKLMGKNDKAAFSDWMQTNYDELFNNLQQPNELISRIETLSEQS